MSFVTTLIALAACAAAPASAADVQVNWTAPKQFIEGASYTVHVEFTAPADGGSIPAWGLTAAAFTLDGKGLDDRSSAKIDLAGGQRVVTDIDLAALIAKKKGADASVFKIGVAKELGSSAPEIEVAVARAAESGLDFQKMEPSELKKFHVYLQTNRGDMVIEFWPDLAPNHVRNYLDLAYTKFYDGVIFHRVGPGFMIQGGDPTGTGSGNGPRTLKSEFTREKKHERGVLSMARTADPNSASCQFFVMHGPAPGLDGQYSIFGKLVSGYETLDKIASAPGTKIDQATVRPTEPQRIEKAIVLRIAK
jgi:peptidyl-prolyl cis-trans isomerase B (cyclophilin B)